MNNNKKKIVVFTGAGISAESGISTFRDSGGLWEQYNVNDVATIDGWNKNPELVMEFYNKRRKELELIKPNKAHFDLVKLEKRYDVHIITQNVDDLHENAGSTNILHLHGELTKGVSLRDPKLIVDIGYNEIKIGDNGVDGEQIRPYVVWFGEGVPKMVDAKILCHKCDILIIIGTSLNVYPAADIIKLVPKDCEIYYVDPNPDSFTLIRYQNIKVIPKKATEGVEDVITLLLNKNEK
jgi:NAD-dependent deacetylase